MAGVDGSEARLAPAPEHADIAIRVSTYREQVTRELSAHAALAPGRRGRNPAPTGPAGHRIHA